MHVGNDTDPGIEADRADAPRSALAEEQFLGRAQHGLGRQFAAAVLGAPDQAVGKAGAAHLARRILGRTAILTDLQLEPAARGGGREPEGGAAALAGRQRRQRRPQHRVLASRFTGDIECHRSLSFTIKSDGGEYGGAAANPAIIVDHPEPGDETMPRIGDAGAPRFAGELADRLDDAEMAARRAGLADR